MPHPLTNYGLPAAVIRMKFRAHDRLLMEKLKEQNEHLAEIAHDSVLVLRRAMEVRDMLLGDAPAMHPGDVGSGTVQ